MAALAIAKPAAIAGCCRGSSPVWSGTAVPLLQDGTTGRSEPMLRRDARITVEDTVIRRILGRKEPLDGRDLWSFTAFFFAKLVGYEMGWAFECISGRQRRSAENLEPGLDIAGESRKQQILDMVKAGRHPALATEHHPHHHHHHHHRPRPNSSYKSSYKS